jgi:hypothetical protein
MAERFAETSKNPFSDNNVLVGKGKDLENITVILPQAQQHILRIAREDRMDYAKRRLSELPTDFDRYGPAYKRLQDEVADPQKLQGFDGVKYYAIKKLDFENAEEFNRVVLARDYSELGRAVSGMGYDFYEFLGDAVNDLARRKGMSEQAMYEHLFFAQMQQIVIRMAHAMQAGEREKDEEKRRKEQLEKLTKFETFMVSDVQGLKGSKLPEGEQVNDVVEMLRGQAASIGFDPEEMIPDQGMREEWEVCIRLGIGAHLAAGPIALY